MDTRLTNKLPPLKNVSYTYKVCNCPKCRQCHCPRCEQQRAWQNGFDTGIIVGAVITFIFAVTFMFVFGVTHWR